MKILIVAAREYPEPKFVSEWIYRLPMDAVVMTRGRSCAEKIAVETANLRGIQVVVMKCIGGNSKSVRNRDKALVNSPDRAIFFCDGSSSDDEMLNRASANMKVLRIGPDGHVL